MDSNNVLIDLLGQILTLTWPWPKVNVKFCHLMVMRHILEILESCWSLWCQFHLRILSGSEATDTNSKATLYLGCVMLEKLSQSQNARAGLYGGGDNDAIGGKKFSLEATLTLL